MREVMEEAESRSLSPTADRSHGCSGAAVSGVKIPCSPTTACPQAMRSCRGRVHWRCTRSAAVRIERRRYPAARAWSCSSCSVIRSVPGDFGCAADGLELRCRPTSLNTVPRSLRSAGAPARQVLSDLLAGDEPQELCCASILNNRFRLQADDGQARRGDKCTALI